jgi:hypothetical protein
VTFLLAKKLLAWNLQQQVAQQMQAQQLLQAQVQQHRHQYK